MNNGGIQPGAPLIKRAVGHRCQPQWRPGKGGGMQTRAPILHAQEIKEKSQCRNHRGHQKRRRRFDRKIHPSARDMKKDERGGNHGGQRQKNFRFGQKNQTETKTGREHIPDLLPVDPIGQERDGQNGKDQAVKQLMGIRRNVIVVADTHVFVKREHQHDAQTDGRGRPARCRRGRRTAAARNLSCCCWPGRPN